MYKPRNIPGILEDTPEAKKERYGLDAIVGPLKEA